MSLNNRSYAFLQGDPKQVIKAEFHIYLKKQAEASKE